MPMRAKHARQIRKGVKQAQFEVRFTMDMGRPPLAAYTPETALERRAYTVTIGREVAHIITRGWTRIEKKLVASGWVSEEDLTIARNED